MRLIIRDDALAASSYVANYIIEAITAFQPTAETPFVLGLPTGSSPLGVYKILVEKYKAGEVILFCHFPQTFHPFLLAQCSHMASADIV